MITFYIDRESVAAFVQSGVSMTITLDVVTKLNISSKIKDHIINFCFYL